MDFLQIAAQVFGFLGFAFAVYSFQEKDNKRLMIFQGLAGLMFFMNFILIGAVSAALFNLSNFARGMILSKNNKKLWRVVVPITLYTACLAVSMPAIWGNNLQIFLSSFTCFTLIIMTVFMWKGNGRNIRYAQFILSSPSWIIHNIFNFSAGGLLCEIFTMCSVAVSFVRYGKDGFDKGE